MLLALWSENVGDGRDKRRERSNFFFTTCLPLQCRSSEVFIWGENKQLSPFQKLAGDVHSIISDVHIPSKTTAECKPQELLDWPSAIAVENGWLSALCFKARNWMSFKILGCFRVVLSIYSSLIGKEYTARLLKAKWCKKISALFLFTLWGWSHPWIAHRSCTVPSSHKICCTLLPSVTWAVTHRRYWRDLTWKGLERLGQPLCAWHVLQSAEQGCSAETSLMFLMSAISLL